MSKQISEFMKRVISKDKKVCAFCKLKIFFPFVQTEKCSVEELWLALNINVFYKCLSPTSTSFKC